MGRTRTIAALIFMLTTALFSVPAAATTLSVVGATSKICQLTGETDWLSGQPTNAKTQSHYGLKGIDLGFPVESDSGTLYLMFGDAVPDGHPPGSIPTVPPDDALGQTTRTAAPDSKTCLDMTLVGGFKKGGFGHPTVTPMIQQGSFNVPSGGIYVDDKFFGFFWTAHCVLPDPYLPNPTMPLVLPPPGAFCPELPLSNSIGRSVLAYATNANPLAFTQVAPLTPIKLAQMPNGFVYVTAAKPPPHPAIFGKLKPPIPVFGVARYRMSIPYLAMAPQATFGNVQTWKFFGGLNGNAPTWLTYQQWQSGSMGGQWSPPPGAEIYPDSANALSPSGDERCVGEHSVTWNAALHAWLMLYTCSGAQVEARTAPEPWGPWTAPTVLLSTAATPSLACTLLWGAPGSTCPPGIVSQQPAGLTFGYLYAPFTMERYTQGGKPDAATIYWLLSTWDPYQVDVMKSTLQLKP